MDTLNRWYERDKDRAEFLVVYIAEAHPTDGWQVPQNTRDGVLIAKHKGLKDRKEAALELRNDLGLTLPIYVDGMDDAASSAYQGWPDRIYVLNRNNVVRYRGGPGPRGFRPREAMGALESLHPQEAGSVGSLRAQSGGSPYNPHPTSHIPRSLRVKSPEGLSHSSTRHSSIRVTPPKY